MEKTEIIEGKSEREEKLREWMAENNVTGYDILRMPGCPYNLPSAKSMTQARDDYYHLLPNLIQWYNHPSNPPEK